MLRLRTLISEASDPKVIKLIKDISKNTKKNDHTGAALALAKFLKNGNAIKILDAINDIQHIEGGMPLPLLQYRQEILTRLLTFVKNNYDNDTYNEISSAF